MSEITIVTAFFDIGRGDMKGFERSNEKYLSYFAFWARMRNQLIVYTDANMAKRVREIRKEFNLEDKTKVIVVDEPEKLDFEVYSKMEKILAKQEVVAYRKDPKCPESYNPKYNYLMYLKSWFGYDAVKNHGASGLVAWLDFGYNHGGKTYDRPEDFDYVWDYDFSEKIHLFALRRINTMPVFDIVKKMPIDMSGGVIVAPSSYWQKVHQMYREAIMGLMMCDFVDDDQTLLIMAYRNYPELFEIHMIEDWFMVLKNFGGQHLHMHENALQRSKYKLLKLKMMEKYYDKEYAECLKYLAAYTGEKIKSKIQK